jgi:DNA polymerase-3 subunit delta
MLTLLYGEDTYRSREELKKIIQAHEKTSLNWFNFVKIDAKDKEAEIFELIRQSANTTSMFSEKKLIIVENISFAEEEEQKNILEFLEKKNTEKDSETTVVFWDEKLDEKSELFKYFKNKAKIQKFTPFKDAQLRSWAKERITSNGGKIEGQALDRLIEYVGNDLWRMTNEINKLLDYDKTIKIENVELLIKPEIDINVFNIVDALGQKNKNQAIKLIGKYFEKGEDEIRLLGMFVYQFRNLLKIKSSAENPGMHYFVFQKSKEQAKNFSFEELKKIYHRLMTIDLDLKLGRVEPMAALELFVTGL